MTRRSIGYAAFAAALGLAMLTTAPTRAAPSPAEAASEQGAAPGKPLALTKQKKARPAKISRSHRAVKATKVAARKAEQHAKAKKITSSAAAETAMPDTVANANAQMPSADAQGSASVTPTPAPAPLEAAANEQMTELGKSLAAPAPFEPAPPVAAPQTAEDPQQTAQLALPDQPPGPAAATPEPNRPLKQARVTASSSDGPSDPWAQSSLIGKIFIAFGGMLTLASAARMLVA